MIYSIIIPVYNEINNLPILIDALKYYDSNEIIIVDDGSNDGSLKILESTSFIKLITLKSNFGKGVAIRAGLACASNDPIIILDSDMEIHPKIIDKLAILNKEKNIRCILGYRYEDYNQLKSFWDYGNYLLTRLFNFIYQSKHKDSLCCAKAFYKKDLGLLDFSSNGFDIDVEITAILTKKFKNINSIQVPYKRRSKKEGKKLRFIDAFLIIKRIIITKLK